MREREPYRGDTVHALRVRTCSHNPSGLGGNKLLTVLDLDGKLLARSWKRPGVLTWVHASPVRSCSYGNRYLPRCADPWVMWHL
jgi:hypothetical protein